MFTDDDLTTDAIPSPPRDEPKGDFPEKESIPPKSSTTHKAKSKGFPTKTKRGATGLLNFFINNNLYYIIFQRTLMLLM